MRFRFDLDVDQEVLVLTVTRSSYLIRLLQDIDMDGALAGGDDDDARTEASDALSDLTEPEDGQVIVHMDSAQLSFCQLLASDALGGRKVVHVSRPPMPRPWSAVCTFVCVSL